VTSRDGLHRLKAWVLNRVASSFIEWVAAGYIAFHLGVAILSHPNTSGGGSRYDAAVVFRQGNSRSYDVLASPEIPEHLGGFGRVARFRK
jgi:hypothetical protein